MCLKMWIGEYTMNYSNEIDKAKKLIKEANAMVIGVGSGLTAAGGLSYSDHKLVERWYPEYFKNGKRTILDIMGDFWPTTINKTNATKFWGFWANHIWHIRYESKALKPYIDLFSLVQEKDYFIVSTNVDGQLEKAGFPRARIFAPQGDYGLFQCSKHCCDNVFYNYNMIEDMINNMPNAFEVRGEDVPKCPNCGEFLIPNIRCDFNFVEAPHIKNVKDYEDFINNRRNKKMVLLELGVGFNTPGIIRFPFEKLTNTMSDVTLIRINRDDIRTAFEVNDNTICIQDDLKKVLVECAS